METERAYSQQSPLYRSIGESSIRLLSIKPGYPSEKIECGLVVIQDLEEAPSYEALSYVWGSEFSPHPIVCNGSEISVTSNLHEALMHLRPLPSWNSVVLWDKKNVLHSSRNSWRDFAKHRYEDGVNSISASRLIWIDALCINQLDFKERAGQVKIMGSIYQRASMVKIWLGKEASGRMTWEARAAKRIMRRIRPQYHVGEYGNMPVVLTFIAQALRNVNASASPLISMRRADDSEFRNKVYGFPAPTAHEWKILRQFFEHAWFQRVWVVQEVVLATRAVVILSDWQIEWSALGKAALWFQEKGFELPPVLKYPIADLVDLLPVSNAAATWKICEISNQRVPLLNLLKDSRSRIASQSVDKLYAAFGLAEEVHPEAGTALDDLIEPDYNRSVKDVYRDAARYLIIEHGNLEVLSHAGESQPSETWPSWVPIWFQEKASMEYYTARTADVHNADASEPLAIGIPDTVDGLVLQGIEVDAIRTYGDRLTSYGFGYVTYQEERDFVLSAWSMLAAQKEDGPYTSKGDLLYAFTTTLTAGLSNAQSAADLDSNYEEDAARWFFEHFKGQIPAASILQQAKWSILPTPDSGRFHEAFVRACMDRRFFITKDGYMGMGPETMKEGDIVVILFGGKVPFVLRPADESYNLVGECYVSGLMKGEAVEQWRHQGRKQEIFELR